MNVGSLTANMQCEAGSLSTWLFAAQQSTAATLWQSLCANRTCHEWFI